MQRFDRCASKDDFQDSQVRRAPPPQQEERTTHDILGHNLADPRHGRDRPARRYGCSSRTTAARSGRSVRALVHRLDERTAPLQALGAEIVVGDLHDRASLVPALEGVGLAYFTYPVNGGIVQAAANFAARRPAGRRTPAGRRDVQRSFSPREPEPLRPRALARRRGAGVGRSGSRHPADRVAVLRERTDAARPNPSATRG